MLRSISFAASLFVFATAASAQAHYSAKPATAPAKTSMVAAGVAWKCVDGMCSAPKTGSRDGIVCEQVAKRVGTLASFSAAGAAFDEAALAKCNLRAR